MKQNTGSLLLRMSIDAHSQHEDACGKYSIHHQHVTPNQHRLPRKMTITGHPVSDSEFIGGMAISR
jgi:hypothetical protein